MDDELTIHIFSSINSTSSLSPPFNDQKGVNWAKAIFSIAICTFGVVGNLVALFVIIVLKEFKKSVTHWYVLQLAIADLMFLLTIPVLIDEDIKGQWDFPNWMCQARELIAFLNYYASMIFLMIMSVDRYVAVCHPFSEKLQSLRTLRAGALISIIVWIICFLLCVNFMAFMVVRGVEPHCKCQFSYGVNIDKECSDDKLSLNDREECHLLKELHQGGSQCLTKEMIESASNSFINDVHSSYINKPGGRSFEESILSPDDTFMQEMFNILKFIDGINTTSVEHGGEGYDFNSISFDGEDKIKATLVPHNGQTNGTAIETEIVASVSLPTACHYRDTPKAWKDWIYLNFFVFFLFPFLVMAICYGLIIRQLMSMEGLQHSSKDRHAKITWMCVALVGNFLLCWSLWHAIHLAKINGITPPNNDGSFCVALRDAANILAFLSAAVNPYLYSFVGTKFSKRWRDATTSFGRSMSTLSTKQVSSDGPGSVHYNKGHNSHVKSTNSSGRDVTMMTKTNCSSTSGNSSSSGLTFRSEVHLGNDVASSSAVNSTPGEVKV